MESQVLHTVWCNISGEATGEIWYWSLLGVKGWRRGGSMSGSRVHFRERVGLIYSCYFLVWIHWGFVSRLPVQVEQWLDHGPREIAHDGECVCLRNSRGVKCKSCIEGFFFLEGTCSRWGAIRIASQVFYNWSPGSYPGLQRFLALGELGPKSRAAGDWGRGIVPSPRPPAIWAPALRERETSATQGT